MQAGGLDAEHQTNHQELLFLSSSFYESKRHHKSNIRSVKHFDFVLLRFFDFPF